MAGLRLSPEEVAPFARPWPVPNFSALDAPDIAVIHAIHRAPDGLIPFAAKHAEGDWCELGALRAGQEPPTRLLDRLGNDGYFGLNGSYRTSRRPAGTREVWKRIPARHPEYGNVAIDFPGAEHCVEKTAFTKTNPKTGLPYSHHQADALRWLNVCYVDLDCYKVGLTVGGALGAIVDMQDAGRLPVATMFARSGRGLWCFWALVDVMNPHDGERLIHGVMHGPWTPQRASRDAVSLYARVQGALAARLRGLGADMSALDGARFAPVPGTLKTATDARVQYWVQASGGQSFAYTLQGLAKALELDRPEMDRAAGRDRPVSVAQNLDDDATRQHRSAAGRRGCLGRWRGLEVDFKTLIRLRGHGFNQGCRNRGAFYYALILNRAGRNEAEIAALVTALGRACRPPLRESEIRAVLRQAERGKKPPVGCGYVSNQRIADELGITDHEAAHLLYLCRKPNAKAEPTTSATDTRCDAIRTIVEQVGYTPTTREMARRLLGTGIDVGHVTVSRDYLRLNLQAQEHRGGRPKKAHLC